MMLGKPTGNNVPVLLFSNPPNFEELCCVSLFLTNPLNSGVSSRNQAQILKCRELIFTEPDIIATPSFGDDRSITVILQRSLHATGRLQARFHRIGLKISLAPQIFHVDVDFEAPISRVFMPHQIFCTGRDFLTSTSCVNAIKMCLTVTSRDVNMALQATVVRTSPFQLKDLNLTPSIQHQFCCEPNAVIPESVLMNTWCHVLPSMKKGKIVSVNKTIPEDSPFKTYRDFKRHWKNTYGYRLPDTDEDISYYQIYFRPIGNNLFTYPGICIRSREFHFLPRVDPKPIMASFLQDIKTKIPTVCGQSLNFQPKAKYTRPGLCAASENLTQSNLTNRMPRVNYSSRDPSMLQRLYNSSMRIQNEEVDNSNRVVSSAVSADNSSHNMKEQDTYLQSSVNKVVNSAGKTVPLFRSKTISNTCTKLQKPSPKKLTPVFKTKTSVNSSKYKVQNLPQHAMKNLPSPMSTAGHDVREELLTNTRQPGPAINPVLFERQIKPSAGLPWVKSPRTVPVFCPSLTLDNLEEDFQLPCPVYTPARQPAHIKTSSVVKRKSCDIDSPVVKKCRSKPQIQEGIDIEFMAKTHQLSRVNAATLVAWMKDHNIPCKAKDKKPDLIEKVNCFLQIKTSEQ